MNNAYTSAMRSNAKRCKLELEEIYHLLSNRSLSNLEYRAAERTLQVAVEACIGVAKHWCKALNQQAATDAYQSFEILCQNGVIAQNQLPEWRKIVGLRNALVHDYLNIDPAIIRAIIHNRHYTMLFSFIDEGLNQLEAQ